jgi:hypothetical protein
MLFQRFLSYTLRKNLAQERSRIVLTTNDTSTMRHCKGKRVIFQKDGIFIYKR